jgi:hypothetical protein
MGWSAMRVLAGGVTSCWYFPVRMPAASGE